MSIDNSLTPRRIKDALNTKTILIILLIVAFLTTIFYITVKNQEKTDILIWYVTAESANCFSDDAIKLVNEFVLDEGFDKLILTRRDPKDQYFAAAMSTSAYYNCDIFIMPEKIAKDYLNTGMFKSITPSGANGDLLLYDGDNAVGIHIEDNYYLLVNAKTIVDEQVIYNIIDILTNN